MSVLTDIQSELKAPKGQYNSFGKYNYRSCEDIVEAVKPLLLKHGATLSLSDDIVMVGDRVYVRATAAFSSKDGEAKVFAFAREPDDKKGMDPSQVTGTASSYARKYALNGLFLIDDSRDADTDEYRSGADKAAPAPQAEARERSPKDIEEMKRWTDGTFSKEELEDIKKNLKGSRYREVFENAKREYAERNLKKKEDIF